mmetsp:Transcript_67701/g.191843  ORF Transcript_67701/g.191843 Transcript_67701/m.191843 type:complete len:213 (-) Transcript_67701:1956-2594(-)
MRRRHRCSLGSRLRPRSTWSAYPWGQCPDPSSRMARGMVVLGTWPAGCRAAIPHQWQQATGLSRPSSSRSSSLPLRLQIAATGSLLRVGSHSSTGGATGNHRTTMGGQHRGRLRAAQAGPTPRLGPSCQPPCGTPPSKRLTQRQSPTRPQRHRGQPRCQPSRGPDNRKHRPRLTQRRHSTLATENQSLSISPWVVGSKVQVTLEVMVLKCKA